MKKLLIAKLGLDKKVSNTSLAKILHAASGLVTIYLVTVNLDPKDQGYYFVLLNAALLYIFIELGFGFVIGQFISHECSKKSINYQKLFQGSIKKNKTLGEIFKFNFYWNVLISIISFILISILGFVFISTKGDFFSDINHTISWLLLVLLTSFSLPLLGILNFFESTGGFETLSKLRLFMAIISNISVWISLHFNWKFYALPAFYLSNNIIILLWIFYGPNILLINSFMSSKLKINFWIKKIWTPYRQSIISSFSAFFIYQFITPISFYLSGPVQAGKIGLFVTLMVVLSQISMSWVVANVPELAFLTASEKFKEKYSLFDRVSNQSKNIYLLFSIAIIFFLILCNLLEFKIAYRFPDFITIISLLSYGYLWHLMIMQCYFVRVHKIDIFYKLHIYLPFFAPFFCIIGYNLNSEFGIAMSLLCLSILFYFPHKFMYFRFRCDLFPQ